MPVDRPDDAAHSSFRTPHVQGDGIALRPLGLADSQFVFESQNEPGMVRSRSAAPPSTLSEAKLWVRKALRSTRRSTYIAWMIVEHGDDRSLGLMVLQGIDQTAGTAEVGYYIQPDARNRGIATAALRAASDWSFASLDLHRLWLVHDADNAPSCRVATAAGFRSEGLLRESRLRFDGSRTDEEMHARLRTDNVTREH